VPETGLEPARGCSRQPLKRRYVYRHVKPQGVPGAGRMRPSLQRHSQRARAQPHNPRHCLSHGSGGGGGGGVGHVQVQFGSVHVQEPAEVTTPLACRAALNPERTRETPAERVGSLIVISFSEEDMDSSHHAVASGMDTVASSS